MGGVCGRSAGSPRSGCQPVLGGEDLSADPDESGAFCRLSVRRRVISKPSVRLGSAPLILLAKYEALRLVLGDHEDSRPGSKRSGSDRSSRRRKQTVSSSQKAWRSQGVGFGKHARPRLSELRPEASPQPAASCS